jgi:hypothetical protein
MKLLTTIAAILISISAFSQEKLTYQGDGIITQGLDTISLEEFKAMCKEKKVRTFHRMKRNNALISLGPSKIEMTYNKAVKKSLIGLSAKETAIYNSKKMAVGLPSSALGIGLLLSWTSDYDFPSGWVPPIAGLALSGVGFYTIFDASTRRNHKYQSDIYFETLVISYNNTTSRKFLK